MTCTPPTTLSCVIKQIHEEFKNEDIVLITIINSEEGSTFCVLFEAIVSINEAETLCEYADQYAFDVLRRQRDLLTPDDTYKYTVTQYFPCTKQTGRSVSGSLFMYNVS